MSTKLARYVFRKIRGRIIPVRIGAETKTTIKNFSKSALRKLQGYENKMIDRKIKAFTSDSVVKIPVFHGSNYNFSKFSHSKIGSSKGTAQGRGFYFTRNKKEAESYGKNVKKFYLKMKNPAIGSFNDGFTQKTISKNDLEKVLKSGDLSDYGEFASRSKVASDLLKYNTNDVDIINDAGVSIFRNNWKKTLEKFRKYTGIDGSIAGDTKTTHYVAYNTDQIMKAPKRNNVYSKLLKINRKKKNKRRGR